MPGTPLLDPLTGQPLPDQPQPVPPWATQFPGAQLAQAAPAWPPQEWLQEEGQPVAPVEPQPLSPQGDVTQAPPAPPSTDNPAAMAGLAPAPPAPVEAAPAAPPAEAQVGPQGMAALDQARQQGHVIDPYTADQHAGPPVTPEQQYYNHLAESAQRREEASKMATDARIAANTDERQQELGLAKDMQRRQQKADDMYMATYKEAKSKRQELDREAIDIANQKIDPKRAWHNMSFGAQLFVGITAALTGATTRSVQTGQNRVVDMLNGMAEQDMKAQQMNLENRTGVLGVRRGLLADDLAAGRDMLDFQYKSINSAYEMGKNAIKADLLKYNNDAYTAAGMVQLQDIEDSQVTLGQTYQNKKHEQIMDDWAKRQQAAQGWGRLAEETRHNQATENAAAGKGMTTEQQRENRMAAAEQRGLVIRGANGDAIGKANTEDEQKQANQVVVHRKSLDTLYKRGLELFKDDWAAPGTKRRSEQDAWNKNWAQERRMASGDTSAPNIRDQEIWGLDTTRMIGDNMDTLNESFDNAVNLGRGVLEHSAIDEDTLKREGFIRPPAPPTPGVTTKLLYEDEHGNVSNDRTGRPLSPEETAAWEQRRSDYEKKTTKLPQATWAYRRQQNNIHVDQRRPGPLPFPTEGTGPID